MSPHDTTARETELRWYAIHTRSHQEKQVRDRLLAEGIEPFLPLSRVQRQWSDRKVWMRSPLFRGYCFAKFALGNSLVILKTAGVARIVGIPKPEPIQDEEIAVLQRVAAADCRMESYDYYAEGTWVEVTRGPLAGLRGQFVRQASHQGLVIRAALIQQAALIHIGASEVGRVE